TIAEERRGDKISDEISDETALMNKTASQALTGIRTVKAFGKEGKEKHRFANRNRYFFRLSVSLEDIFASFDSATWSLSRIMQALSILLGGVLVIKRGLTLGQLASYVEYVNSLVWPMLELGWLVSSFANSNASARKIKEVLDNYDEVIVKEPIQMLPKEDRTIEFKHVSLTLDGKAILKDINFKITKGNTLGIMGETGSGKSTIVNLLTRFLEPTSGVIRIGGVDITHLKTEELRANISTVTQDIFLFSETIRENLTKGKQGKISEEEMIKLATLSDANSFISRLESNYDTVIGERGVGLSGGQKQRLCIARALLKNSPILALDDSTSALDMETEKEIQHSLKSLNPDWIKLIIAHRISAVRKAEEIIYLENGKIVERGTHDELMALKGRYYSTFIAQYSKEAINEC
ncbi:MAG: ABC transporter ATP-binding protein, partial [Spirochaetales bacterium]|nr:ABC transporter ATP-binding protein [Spirochaetales bacterium]